MDDKTFELLYKEYFTLLCNISNSIVKDSDVAKDVVQQVFLKLWNKKDDLKIQSSIRSYLHRAIINTSLNHLEMQKKMISFDKDVFENSSFNLSADRDDHQKSELIKTKIELAIKKLSPRCQTVFTLSKFHGMKNKEIAEHMDISIKTVENQMGKALKLLREDLKPILQNIIFSMLMMSWIKIFL